MDKVEKMIDKKIGERSYDDVPDSLPWKDYEDLLEAVVYHLETDWNNHYNDIRDAFKPVIKSVYDKLVGDR